MAYVPQSATLRPGYGYKPKPAESVKRTPSESGKSQAIDLWGRTRFQPEGVVFLLTFADKETMRAFYVALRVQQFYFYDYDRENVVTETLGSGDGSTTIFSVKAREIDTVTVYDNGSPMASYTIGVGTGANGEDRITFAVAPASGHALTISYTGRRQYLCEFFAPHEIEPVNVSQWRVTWYVREVL